MSVVAQAREPGWRLRILFVLAVLPAAIVPFFWDGAPYIGAFLVVFVAVCISPPVWLLVFFLDWLLRVRLRIGQTKKSGAPI